jgi:hypothetical protein
MRKGDKPVSSQRRSFIKLMGLGGVTGAAAASGIAPKVQAASEPAKGGNYRETPHVKKFYELAKF